MKNSNKLRRVFSIVVPFATAHGVYAAGIVLDPGPGTNYLIYWCGGQQVNEIATGFDADGNATTLVKVTTSCHGSGRGSPNQYHLACWTVTFGREGDIFSKESLGTYSWVQGHPAATCPVPADPTAVYDYQDGEGNFPATLSSQLMGSAYRAVLNSDCSAFGYGMTASGTIDTPGEEPCFSFSGHAGDGFRVTTTNVSGDLFPMVAEVHRPDGTLLCSVANDPINCALDVDGAYNIAVHDLNGAGTGSFDITLTCLTPSCGAILPQPHLTIGMSASDSGGRVFRVLNYMISVENDGDASAGDVTLTDSFPPGVYVRGASSSAGSCAHDLQSVNCTLGSIAPAGGVQVNITALVGPKTSTVTNTACADTDTCVTKTSEFP